LIENERLAIRVAEITNDYRNLQHYIAQIRGASSDGDRNDAGYVVLRQCALDAQALLTANFNTGGHGAGDDAEPEKAQLQRYDLKRPRKRRTSLTVSLSIMIDASLRRFQAQRIMQRATAATRWLNSCSAVLQGQKPHAGHVTLLQQIDNQLRAVCIVDPIEEKVVPLTFRTGARVSFG
jgi:hypothetical protein